MHDPKLGELKAGEQSDGELVGQIGFQGSMLQLNINPDGESIDRAIQFATDVTANLEGIVSISKAAIVRDLLESYNGGWNNYDIAQDDGSFKTVENPKLNASDFESKFTLKGISICGDSNVDLCFDDDGLFWGHSVFVVFLDGLGLEHADAQLFG